MFQYVSLASVVGIGVLVIACGVSQSVAEESPSSRQIAQFPDAHEAPPKAWKGPVFRLRQDYPQLLPPLEEYPWKKYNFRDRTQWKDYLQAVLTYCYEGNIEVDWELARNSTRAWYHAPWMHWGRNGREFVHGLTHERPSLMKELADTQSTVWQNWAVGMYNAPGGYTLGRVWADPDKPYPGAGVFPENSVAIKLLFTQASVDEVPYLNGSVEWDANIYEKTVIPTNPQIKRKPQKVRLLQIDVAVRDSRASSTTGWVFGSFTYSDRVPGKTPWERVEPIGISWGNDPVITADMVSQGVALKETYINPNPELPRQHLGWGGRLNGPVDNPMSSCLSCHSTAQAPLSSPLIPPSQIAPGTPQWMVWFRNIKSGVSFDPGSVSLDYSLQLSTGIQNFAEWKDLVNNRGGVNITP